MSIDFDAGGAPLADISVTVPSEFFRLGGPPGAPTCAADKIAAGALACPAASRVAAGMLSLPLPAVPDPGSDEFADPAMVTLSGYAVSPGEIDLLATGYQPAPFTALMRATVSGSTLTLALPPAITSIPGAQLGELTLDLGLSGGPSWASVTGCQEAWQFSAVAGTASATSSYVCPLGADPADVFVPDPPDDTPSDLPSVPSRPSRTPTSSGSRRGSGNLCGPPQAGVQCGPGNGRRTTGGTGTGKVSHRGWPAVTGILWIADNAGRTGRGTSFNDELLGGNGSDTLSGGPGHDILWGDQHPFPNGTTQRDTLRGGPGRDWIYTSHGTNTVLAGAGADHVYAYYGHGSVDCGPGVDTLWIRRSHQGAYAVRRCEKKKYF